MKVTWLEVLKMETVAEWDIANPADRIIRNSISKLRKQGIVFIPVKSDKAGWRKYIRFENASETERKIFAASQLKAWKTQYFNTILPIKSEIHDAKLVELMGNLQ